MSTSPPEPEQEQSSHPERLAALLILLGRDREQLLRSGTYFIWDAAQHRYWDLITEDIVSPTTLRVWVDAALTRTQNRIAWLTRRLINGNISYPQWATMVQQEIKAVNVGLAQIAIGGEWNATTAGRLGARMKFLYQKLTDLGLEYERGEVSPKQMLNRINMAVEAGRGTYEGMVRGMMMDAGLSEEQRTLGSSRHCEDCPPISGYWAPIGSLPAIGDTQCITNCTCSFDYR